MPRPAAGRDRLSGRRFYDALVLYAVAAGRGNGVDLPDVLMGADYVNRVVLSPDEIEHAVRFLRGAGLVDVRGDRLFATADAVRLYDEAPGDGAYATVKSLERELNRLGDVAPAPWSLTDEAYEMAVDEYRARFRGR